jgi:hypothetical protein
MPPFCWIGDVAYRFVARNRYAVSKCRGGACRVACPDEVKKKTFFGTFWSCYLIGLLIRLPLIVGAGVRDFLSQCFAFLRTFRRRVDFPGGKLSILFLGGVPLRRSANSLRGTTPCGVTTCSSRRQASSSRPG